MLGEMKRSKLNANLKKNQDRKIRFRRATGSEFGSEYNKLNIFYKKQKGDLAFFWNGDSYYTAEILPVQSLQ